jgi:VIT1/CCC1 family predicted Fe2+/Mn2+ transporter
MDVIRLKKDQRLLLQYQRFELTEATIYHFLARRSNHAHNRAILKALADEETSHVDMFSSVSKRVVKPHYGKVLGYQLLSVIFGVTFAVKRLERNRPMKHRRMKRLQSLIPDYDKLVEEEAIHESRVADTLIDARTDFFGSMVLGLNDALVELTGALAGLTLAFNNLRIISLSAVITGVSASFSMAASKYLADRADNIPKAITSAIYTGIAYIVTVACLTAPYLFFSTLPESDYPTFKWVALGTTLLIVVSIIAFFNYYMAIVKNYDFKKRFFEMFIISLVVMVVAFMISIFMRELLDIPEI